jgi:MtN3 and saliva related transmembrane protein
MNAVQILGLLAGSLTTAAFVPQVVKTWKSRSAKDLSLGMFSFFCLGVAMWLVYGFAVRGYSGDRSQPDDAFVSLHTAFLQA